MSIYVLILTNFHPEISHQGNPFGKSIMPVDALLIGLFDGNYCIIRKVRKLFHYIVCHSPHTVFHELRVHMGSFHDDFFVGAFQDLKNAGTHGTFNNVDNAFEGNIEVVCDLD